MMKAAVSRGMRKTPGMIIHGRGWGMSQTTTAWRIPTATMIAANLAR
jgi:hypothetical protein